MTIRLTRRSLVGLAAASAIAPSLADAATARLWSFADDVGHEMPYVWRPATDPMKARTLVILHGHGSNETPSAISNPKWNIIVPLDRFGYEGDGSWWLGEDGDFFAMRLLHGIVGRLGRRVGRRLNTEPGLYFSGSSMGGYGALLHGMLLGARAVYAASFQSRLSGTAFTDALSYAIDPVGVPAGSPLGNLSRYVSGKSRLPRFVLDFNHDDHADLRYYDEHFVPFVAACEDRGVDCRATTFEASGHLVKRSYAEIMDLLADH